MKFDTRFAGLFGFALLFAFTPSNDAQALETLTSSSVPAIISEMNTDRVSRGLSPLRVDPSLTSAAQSRSQFLSREGRIYHVSAPAGTPWPELWNAGYRYTEAGENLALGIETTATLEDRWMNSPTHRDNILNGSYQDVGVGVTSGTFHGTPASYVVVYFGKKAPTGAVPVSSASTVRAQAPIAQVQALPVKQITAPAPTSYVQGKTAQSQGGTTQSTVVASDASAVVPTSPAVSQDDEKVRILTRLISYLQSYLKILSS